MSEMIERAAKAIFGTHHEATLIQWDELSVQAQEEFLTQARAAIEVMREPTYEMRHADDVKEWPEDAGACWKAMIGVALSQSNGERNNG